jgi:hypothetical protein
VPKGRNDHIFAWVTTLAKAPTLGFAWSTTPGEGVGARNAVVVASSNVVNAPSR